METFGQIENHAKKKTLRYRERDAVQRWLFQRELHDLRQWCENVLYLDECGVDHRLFNPCARAPRGEAVCADIPGARCGRTSVISASRGNRLVCPFTFEGHCNGEVVETYFRDLLLPAIPKGSVVVLDNASFHGSAALQALVEASGCFLMFLPAYSPDLNPIEHIWSALKKHLRDKLPLTEDKRACIDDACNFFCK